MSEENIDPIWEQIQEEASKHVPTEPILASFLQAVILNHNRLELALSFHLASQLDSPNASSAHWLWTQGRESLALFFQNRMSAEFCVDIHPAARMGRGILLDHATGLVIGETAVIGNNVSILQAVTLGGTGKDEGDRHPKIGDGVLISAGAKILGNIHVGEGAKVGAGSVVLEDVPAHTTVAGVPAKIVGKPSSDQPALEMDHGFSCDDAGLP
jgi:serine O-acetyltransferase